MTSKGVPSFSKLFWLDRVVAEQLAGGLEVSLFAGYGTIVSSPVMFIFL